MVSLPAERETAVKGFTGPKTRSQRALQGFISLKKGDAQTDQQDEVASEMNAELRPQLKLPQALPL